MLETQEQSEATVARMGHAAKKKAPAANPGAARLPAGADVPLDPALSEPPIGQRFVAFAL